MDKFPFHEPSNSCKCTLCDQLCERYHLERCKKEDKINKRLCFTRYKCQTIETHTFMYGCLAAINVLLLTDLVFLFLTIIKNLNLCRAFKLYDL